MRSQYFIFHLFILFSVGCAQSYSNIERKVQENNTFISSHYPEISIQINRDLQFIGKYENKLNKPSIQKIHTTNVEIETYVFAQLTSENQIERGIIIDFRRLTKRGAAWMTRQYQSLKYKLDEKFIKILGVSYEQIVIANTLFGSEYLPKQLMDDSYMPPNWSLQKVLARIVTRNSDILMHIIYFEDISRIDNWQLSTLGNWWKPEEALDESQRSFLNEFEDRYSSALKILGN